MSVLLTELRKCPQISGPQTQVNYPSSSAPCCISLPRDPEGGEVWLVHPTEALSAFKLIIFALSHTSSGHALDHDVEEELMEDKVKKVKKVKSDTIDNTETPQDTIDKHTVDVVPHDEENLKFFQPLNPKKRRKPYPTKMNPKNQCNGQTKISSFFSNTRTGKR